MPRSNASMRLILRVALIAVSALSMRREYAFSAGAAPKNASATAKATSVFSNVATKKQRLQFVSTIFVSAVTVPCAL